LLLTDERIALRGEAFAELQSARAVSKAKLLKPEAIQTSASSRVCPRSSVVVDARWSKVRRFLSFQRHHDTRSTSESKLLRRVSGKVSLVRNHQSSRESSELGAIAGNPIGSSNRYHTSLEKTQEHRRWFVVSFS
jgi:hypothetical protein